MIVIRDLKQNEAVDGVKLEAGQFILDGKRVVELDEGERSRQLDYHRAQLKEHRDSTLGLTQTLLDTRNAELAAMVPELAGVSDLVAALAILKASLPLNPLPAIESASKVPRPLADHLLDGLPDYEGEASSIRSKFATTQALEPLFTTVAPALAGDPRVARWLEGGLTPGQLLLTFKRSEKVRVVDGVLDLWTPEEEAKAQTILTKRLLDNPPALNMRRDDWLNHKAAVLQVYPELADTYAKVESAISKASCKGCERNRQLALIATAASLCAQKDKTAGTVRDMGPLAGLFPEGALSFLTTPSVPKGGAHLPLITRSTEHLQGMAHARMRARTAADGGAPPPKATRRLSPEHAKAIGVGPEGKRNTCLNCYRKHVAQAQVLLWESLKGYPSHIWLAVAHLEEACEETEAEYPELAATTQKTAESLRTRQSAEGFNLTPLINLATSLIR